MSDPKPPSLIARSWNELRRQLRVALPLGIKAQKDDKPPPPPLPRPRERGEFDNVNEILRRIADTSGGEPSDFYATPEQSFGPAVGVDLASGSDRTVVATGEIGPPVIPVSNSGDGGLLVPADIGAGLIDAMRQGTLTIAQTRHFTIPPVPAMFQFRHPIGFADRGHALLSALALPTPRGDGGHQFYAALAEAFERNDSVPWVVFADWCVEQGFGLWEEIAREVAAKFVENK